MPEGVSPTFAIQASGTTPAPEPQVAVTPTTAESTQTPAQQAANAQQQMTARRFADKYTSVEDLEKGYKELQAKVGQKFPDTSGLDIPALLQRAGLKNEEIITNWSTEGKLTDAQYGKFQAIGFNRTVVDAFLAGQQAIAAGGQREQETIKMRAYEMAGGAEQLQNLLNWAGNNYQSDKVDDLNQRLASARGFEGALKELLFDYKQAVGAGFTRPMASGSVMPNTASGFASVSELVKAMSDARKAGHFDEALKRRIANTPQHILEGVDRQ
jgi:hypothetical protein